jgi:anti-sigma factor RsiW
MSTKTRSSLHERLDAFLDGELPEQEQAALQAHLLQDAAARQLADYYRTTQQTIQQSLQETTQQAMRSIDFDAFSDRLMARIQCDLAKPAHAQTAEAAPIAIPAQPQIAISAPTTAHQEPAKETSSFNLWTLLQSWFQAHPALSLAVGCSAVVLVVFSLPLLMDPGPAPNDVVVDEVAGNKRAQVAVLQTNDKRTGQQMTVIVVNEPDDQDDEKEKTDHNKKKQGKKAPKTREK